MWRHIEDRGKDYAIRAFVILEFLASLGMDVDGIKGNEWDDDELGEAD